MYFFIYFSQSFSVLISSASTPDLRSLPASFGQFRGSDHVPEEAVKFPAQEMSLENLNLDCGAAFPRLFPVAPPPPALGGTCSTCIYPSWSRMPTYGGALWGAIERRLGPKNQINTAVVLSSFACCF